MGRDESVRGTVLGNKKTKTLFVRLYLSDYFPGGRVKRGFAPSAGMGRTFFGTVVVEITFRFFSMLIALTFLLSGHKNSF